MLPTGLFGPGWMSIFESPARVAALRATVRREQPFVFPTMAAKENDADLAFELTPLLQSGIVLAGGGRDPGAVPVDAVRHRQQRGRTSGRRGRRGPDRRR